MQPVDAYLNQASQAGVAGSGGVLKLDGQLRLLRTALTAMNHNHTRLAEQVAQIHQLTSTAQEPATWAVETERARQSGFESGFSIAGGE